MRDKLKDTKYFDLYLSKQIEDLIYYKKTLFETDISKGKIIESLRNTIFTINFEILVARYSKGDDLNLIREE